MSDETTAGGRRRWLGTIAVSVVLPLLAAWVLVWSTADRREALDRVPVAIVNSDTILTDPQPMAAGRALSASLLDPSSDDEQLDWTLTDADDAGDGLRDGTYYAVLTIPTDFSAAILSTGTTSPASGQLQLESNAAASTTLPYISEQVVAAAADALGNQSTQAYLKQVYGGFNQLADANETAAESAGELADGTAQLAAGASELDDGTQSLAASLAEVATGAAALEEGTASLSSGAGRLAQGAGELARGTRELARGLAGLAGDADRLATRAAVHAERSRTATRGATLVAEGAERLTTATGRLSTELGDLARQCVSAGASVEFCAGLREARARSRVVDLGSRVVTRATDGLALATSLLAEGAQGLADADRALATGTRSVAGAGGRLARSATGLATGTSDLAAAAAEVDTSTGELADGTAATSAAAESLASGGETLDASAASVDDGAHQLSSGLAKGAKQSPTYSKGEQNALAATVSQPVQLSHATEHTEHANGWLLGAILGVILWLAALAAVSRADVSASRHFALAPVSSRRIAVVQVLPVLGLAVLQGVAVVLALVLTDVSVASAVGVALLSVLAAVSFGLVAYALRLALGAAGVALFVLFLLVQVAALANVLPLETAPDPLPSLHGLMPLTMFVDGASRLVSGGEVGSVTTAVVVIALWGLAAFASTLLVVRRRRMLPAAAPAAPPAGLPQPS
ncbi:YhgE/Pip family protein [Nocardioides euryhalodurans]|uniref:ABC-2 type transporter transmembrane domain-containing protein n=1 Tax=Nocardioides euryhalodurans TaxID=2518370 RepID=A0A4P7GPU6_9ACTN|nr:YhgE/Pip family protein [Nocardioides euryhalodurans]QBR93831.1 hypothetical protein EXE57_17245 [Nocardioides euryhalodurans]